ARVLADCLCQEPEPVAALRVYEAVRAGPAAEVVRTNRTQPPDFINIRVEELTGDRPFDNLDDYITQEELRALSDRYKQVAGYGIDQLQRPGGASSVIIRFIGRAPGFSAISGRPSGADVHLFGSGPDRLTGWLVCSNNAAVDTRRVRTP